jgi:hypothetical protein
MEIYICVISPFYICFFPHEIIQSPEGTPASSLQSERSRSLQELSPGLHALQPVPDWEDLTCQAVTVPKNT